MNRFKFRVWDRVNMYYPSYPLQSSNCDELGNACVVQGLLNCNYIESDVIFQQFTGLLDKNGKEIYEGDILQYGNLNYEVSWQDYQWAAACPYYNRYHWPRFEYFNREARSSKVIGNIYENPHLLEKNEKSVKNI